MSDDFLNSMSRTEWTILIDEWCHSERDRAMIKRRILDGICYEPLAEEFDMSVVQVKRIVGKFIKRIQIILGEEDGVN